MYEADDDTIHKPKALCENGEKPLAPEKCSLRKPLQMRAGDE